MNKNINYDDMSEYFTKSARTLRRWEIEKPQKFAIMLDEYNFQLAKENDSEGLGEVIVVTSLKGGVGKSTGSDSLGFYLGDAIIFNVDISQRSKNVNACKTIDYADLKSKYTISQIVNDLKKKYKYIIIDTPGDATAEVYESLQLSKKIIIPMTIGKRARETTIRTLDVFFGEHSNLEGDYKIYFFFNAYTNKKKRLSATKKFIELFEIFIENRCSKNLKISSKLGALDYSDAISTAEEEGKSIFTLATENRSAYKSILGKIQKLCSNIESYFDL